MTRKSIDAIAVKHPEVAPALRFIRERYEGRLAVSDVAGTSRLSRRGLENAFRTQISRTIDDEVLRVRLARARRLLARADPGATLPPLPRHATHFAFYLEVPG